MPGTQPVPGTAPMTRPVEGEAPAQLGPASREWPLALLFLAPSLAVFGVFIFYPLFRTMWLGTRRTDPFGGSRSVGFDQYADVLQSAQFRKSLWVTVQFTLLTVPLGLALGLGLAVLAHQRLRGIAVFRTLFSSTVATSVAVASLMWLTLLNPSIGLINSALDAVGRGPINFLNDPQWALPSVSFATVWLNLGFTFIVMSAGLQSVPDELLESATIDGAGPWMRFRHVTLPLLSPTLAFAVVVLTINAFQSFGQIDLLTEGGPLDRTNVVVYSIFEQAFEQSNQGAAAAQAVVLFGILLLLTVVQFRFLERRVFYGS
jgi:sn-glycerol 3-phosphate transport system permease protein